MAEQLPAITRRNLAGGGTGTAARSPSSGHQRRRPGAAASPPRLEPAAYREAICARAYRCRTSCGALITRVEPTPTRPPPFHAPDARWSPPCPLIPGGVGADERTTMGSAGRWGTGVSASGAGAVAASGTGTAPSAVGTRRRAAPGARVAPARGTAGPVQPCGPPSRVWSCTLAPGCHLQDVHVGRVPRGGATTSPSVPPGGPAAGSGGSGRRTRRRPTDGWPVGRPDVAVSSAPWP